MIRTALVATVVLAVGSPARAEPDRIPVPKMTGPVVDLAGLLTRTEVGEISAALQNFHRTAGHQLQVLIVPTINDETVEQFSIRVAEAWQSGDAKRDDGVLLTVVTKDRHWRIEVGNGIEGELTDIESRHIGLTHIIPNFRAGQFARGIFSALQAVARELGGELGSVSSGAGTSSRAREERPPSGLSFLIMLLVFFFIFRGGGFFGGMLLGGALGRSSRGWSSGRGFGGGGWRGGGGGFSGGGASGSW